MVTNKSDPAFDSNAVMLCSVVNLRLGDPEAALQPLKKLHNLLPDQPEVSWVYHEVHWMPIRQSHMFVWFAGPLPTAERNFTHVCTRIERNPPAAWVAGQFPIVCITTGRVGQ
jgi:hypothetical protein